jgi:four helix bundle protein
MMPPYERLEAWQHARRLALDVYKATSGWPTRELYGLVSQTRRAAVSVLSNIAEGASKRGKKEFGRHLDIALGSFAELTCLLGLSVDLGYSSAEESKALETERAETGKLLWGLYRRMRPASTRSAVR